MDSAFDKPPIILHEDVADVDCCGFPNHVQNLIALNRPPGSIERSKTLAGIHPPLDPSMVLFHYII
jgi:hypothetical protein